MNDFDKLLQSAGEWIGRYRVQTSPAEPAEESPSRLTVMPILKGNFLRLDQEWSWKGEPQSGCLLIGYFPEKQLATIHWMDPWHNGRGTMPLTGQFDPAGKLIAHGSFAVEGEPDWGWRIEIQGGDELTLNMFCVNPASGKDEGGVWSSFSRANG
ncbi:MAG TPA: DUF1579 family protein [Roseimicrobium sp.]|nr:DUF1579 family protein [Roseimicrobium sp.]